MEVSGRLEDRDAQMVNVRSPTRKGRANRSGMIASPHAGIGVFQHFFTLAKILAGIRPAPSIRLPLPILSHQTPRFVGDVLGGKAVLFHNALAGGPTHGSVVR